MKILSILLLLALGLVFVKTRVLSFGAQSPEDYAGTTPAFSIKEQLSGRIASEGIVFGPRGRMTSSFVADMYGEWDGNTGTLTEDFTYSNGTKRQRKWFLTINPDGTLTLKADDIVGEGKGIVSGATLALTYTITLPEDAGGHTLDARDWLYLTDDGVILNKSELRKFGLKVAELVATMRPAN